MGERGLEEGRAGRQSVGSVLLDGALPQLFYHRRLSLSLCRQRRCIDQLETVPTLSTPQSCSWLQFLQSNPKRRQPRHIILVILNRQSRAERQNTFDWLHILPVRVTISQYKSYSASGSHILQSCSAEIICSLTVNFVRLYRSALLCRFSIPHYFHGNNVTVSKTSVMKHDNIVSNIVYSI